MDVIASIWQSAVPLVLAALAGMLAQRTGIWHLGLGGLLSIGAMSSVAVTVQTGSIALGMLVATVACVAMSAVMWACIVALRANPIIVGIGVNALGLGGTALALVAINGSEGAMYSPEVLPRPLAGILTGSEGRLSIIALLTPVILLLVWWVVCRTRFGLQLTATGDYPFAARSAGVPIARMRFIALAAGGVLTALAGAELALGPLGAFTQNMEAGRGLIAFAAVILGAAHPLGTALAAIFFGAVSYFGIWAQLNLAGIVDPNFMLMLPYVVTIIAVVITARVRGAGRSTNLVELRDG